MVSPQITWAHAEVLKPARFFIASLSRKRVDSGARMFIVVNGEKKTNKKKFHFEVDIFCSARARRENEKMLT